ncbi:MAG: type II toxin-antitoxin system Y4mF family antitoxin [Bacteroidota bacterium]
MDTKKIGKIIHFHRKKSGLTQKQLAELADVGKSVIFDIEKGKESIQLNSLKKILEALNITMELKSPLIHLTEINDEKSQSI